MRSESLFRTVNEARNKLRLLDNRYKSKGENMGREHEIFRNKLRIEMKKRYLVGTLQCRYHPRCFCIPHPNFFVIRAGDYAPAIR